MSEARTYRQLASVVALWLVCVTLLGLGMAGCMTEKQRAAERRARFKAMMNDTNQMDAISERSVQLRKELHPLWRGPWSDMRRDNLEKLRKLE